MIHSARRVRKRDGREVPFDQNKIVEAIWRAARSIGGGDRLLAEELGSVVAMFVERDHGKERIPTIDQVSDLIERVLVETGHTRTAKAYILERERRDRIRQALRVRDDEMVTTKQGIPPAVDARGRATASPWSKARIVEALVLEAEVPENVAAEIASEVERRVFASGLTRISTSMIRALVDNELFERGLTRWINRQATLGLPRYDLDRMARSGTERSGGAPRFGRALDHNAAALTWSQYALLEVHSPEIAEAHASGWIHLGGLSAPMRFQSLEFDCARWHAGRKRTDVAVDLLDEGELRGLTLKAGDLVSDRVVLRGVEIWVLAALERGDEPTRVARTLLRSLAVPLEVETRTFDIDIVLPVSSVERPMVEFLLAVVAESGRLEREWKLPRLVFTLRGAKEAAPELLAAIALAEPWSPLAPNGERRVAVRVERATDAALIAAPLAVRIGVNVAKTALAAPRDEPAHVIESLVHTIGLAATAAKERHAFLASLAFSAAPRERGKRLLPELASSLNGGRYEIAISGLDAAARALTGGSLVSAEGFEYARELVDIAAKTVAREAERSKLPLVLSLECDPDALAHFGRADFERHTRGRDAFRLQHDGTRYLYSPTLPPPTGDGSDPTPQAAARIESALRRGLAPSHLGNPFALAEERVQFLRIVAPLLEEDVLPCA